MLSGSTIARAILLLVAAAAAIGLAGAYWLRDGAPSEEPAVAAVRPGPTADAQPAPSVQAEAPEPVTAPPAPQAEAPTPAPAPTESAPAPAPGPALAAEEPKSAPSAGPGDAGTADAAAPLDLNTASVEALNRLAERSKLKKPATFGPTVAKHRPYKSVDELLRRKIINKAKFERIKDRVAVR